LIAVSSASRNSASASSARLREPRMSPVSSRRAAETKLSLA
jgi:hypothetical protein